MTSQRELFVSALGELLGHFDMLPPTVLCAELDSAAMDLRRANNMPSRQAYDGCGRSTCICRSELHSRNCQYRGAAYRGTA